nr:organic solute transporter Ost-alpha [Tanacetum cinerariifolium]
MMFFSASVILVKTKRDDELSDKEIKQIEADDQAIQTILLGLPEDIYAAEKKAKLFNEWEMFTSNKGESIESYYHRFLKLMNDLKRNKHFPEKIASNLKFLNNLQPEWSRHVTIVHQTKDLHTADYTQLYDFLKYNQKEVDDLKAERLAKTQDLLALMANSNNPYNSPAHHQDQSSFSQNYLQQPMPNPEDITDPTTAMNMALALMAKAFKLNYSTPTNNNQRISSNPRNMQIAQPRNPAGYNDVIGNQVNQKAVQNPRVQNVGNHNGLIGVQRNGNQNQIGNGNLVAARVEGNAAGQIGNQIRCYNCRGKEEARLQLQAKEYDLMAVATYLDEIEEVNANCILMANLQQASTSGTQTDSTPVYDTDGSAELHENCDDNEIANMFTQEEQYIELLEPIPESHQVPQNDNDVISEDSCGTRALDSSFLGQEIRYTIVTLVGVLRREKSVNRLLGTEDNLVLESGISSIGINEQMGIASIVYLYVFPSEPYKLMVDIFVGDFSVLVDYFTDFPLDPDKVRDSERPTKLRLPRSDYDVKNKTTIIESVRDVFVGGK